jgi:c-di-GMP-binding flagellar brake protein YcgR
MEYGLQVNQPVKVTRTGQEDWYSASVQDVTDDYFCISVPSKGSNVLALQDGDVVELTFGYEDGRLGFKTMVLGKRYDNIPLYTLALPKEYKRIQARAFVRCSVLLDALYAELPEEGQAPVFSTCYIVDLSGGGARVLLTKTYPVDTKLLLKFSLPFKARKESFEVTVRVARSLPADNTEGYYLGVEFLDINRNKQDLIARFVLAKMASQRLVGRNTKDVHGSGKKDKL